MTADLYVLLSALDPANPLQRSIDSCQSVGETHILSQLFEATKINYKTDFLLTGCIEISIAVILLVHCMVRLGFKK